MNEQKKINDTLRWIKAITSDFEYIPRIMTKREMTVKNIFKRKIKNCGIKAFLAKMFF